MRTTLVKGCRGDLALLPDLLQEPIVAVDELLRIAAVLLILLNVVEHEPLLANNHEIGQLASGGRLHDSLDRTVDVEELLKLA